MSSLTRVLGAFRRRHRLPAAGHGFCNCCRPAGRAACRLAVRRPQTNSRRGAVLVLALVCLLVVTALGGLMLQAALSSRRQSLRRAHQLQALWLAESAVARARAALAAAPEYTGETWRISAEELGGTAAAVVEIRVEPAGDPPAVRRIEIQAAFPDDPQQQVVWRQTAEIPLPSPGEDS